LPICFPVSCGARLREWADWSTLTEGGSVPVILWPDVSVADLLNQLGTALADRYRFERELGRGGMATVRRSSHPIGIWPTCGPKADAKARVEGGR
jgi:hypothetical protein